MLCTDNVQYSDVTLSLFVHSERERAALVMWLDILADDCCAQKVCNISDVTCLHMAVVYGDHAVLVMWVCHDLQLAVVNVVNMELMLEGASSNRFVFCFWTSKYCSSRLWSCAFHNLRIPYSWLLQYRLRIFLASSPLTSNSLHSSFDDLLLTLSCICPHLKTEVFIVAITHHSTFVVELL